MRSVKSHKALLLEEVIRLAYGLHCFGYHITSERTNKHRACIYKCANSLSGNPWNPCNHISEIVHFLCSMRTPRGLRGSVPWHASSVCGTQTRCLRIRSEVFFRIADSKYIVVIVELLIIESCVVLCRCKEVLPTRRLPQYYVNNDRNFWYRGGHFFMYSMIKVTTIAIMVRTTIRIS